FEFYEIYGTQDWGDVFMTSYYEPVIPGSRRRTDEHPSPLLKKPDDLIEVALDLFDARFKDIRRMRGRLIKERSLSGNRVMVPYYSRQEIEQDGALSNRRLELAWVDPIDNFFLQVQGSGTVQF